MLNDGRPEPRNEECTRCGCIVLEQSPTTDWSVYACPACGNTWSWPRQANVDES